MFGPIDQSGKRQSQAEQERGPSSALNRNERRTGRRAENGDRPFLAVEIVEKRHQLQIEYTNPFSGVLPGESVWIDHILLYNLSEESVVSTERTFDEDVVPVDTPEGPIDIPLSDHFGMRSVIEVP